MFDGTMYILCVTQCVCVCVCVYDAHIHTQVWEGKNKGVGYGTECTICASLSLGKTGEKHICTTLHLKDRVRHNDFNCFLYCSILLYKKNNRVFQCAHVLLITLRESTIPVPGMFLNDTAWHQCSMWNTRRVN